jgi:MoaA/NifB/PqqE/SkfB family radical SAM enzyme
MTESMVDFIIKRSVPYAKEIELEGTGESLMSPYFGKLFCAIKQAKTPQVMLITNGSLLSDTLLEKFLGTGIQLVFSVDGCNSEEYKKIRSAGNFNIIIENIKKTATLFNSHNSGESCVINMVLSKINLYSVKNMIDLAVNLGIDFLNISEIRP